MERQRLQQTVRGALRRITTAVAGIGLAAAVIAPIGAPALVRSGGLVASVAHADQAYSPADAMPPLEAQFLDLLNADRIGNGLAPLEYDASLAAIARWRSEDMASRGYFSHDIGGYQVFQVLKDQGISYRIAGENLAFNYFQPDQTAPAAEQALMQSPGHRANILRPDYTHAGVGIAFAPDGRVLFTQIFKTAW